MKKLLILIVVAAVAFVSFEAFTASPVLANPEIGSDAPEFSLRDQTGKEVDLQDLKGKIVVLEWTNPDCPYVQRHYREETMKKLQAEYGDKGVAWLAVNSTHYYGADKNKEWAEANKLEYSILDDTPGAVGKQYGAKTTPHMFVIDAEGRLRYQGAIDNDKGGSKPAAERTNYVDQALTQILAGNEVAVPETAPYGCSVKYAG